MTEPVAGWYPDPYDAAKMRWFDGHAWTEETRALPASAQPAAQPAAQAVDAATPTAAAATGAAPVAASTGADGSSTPAGSADAGAGGAPRQRDRGMLKGLLLGAAAASVLYAVFSIGQVTGRFGATGGEVFAPEPAASAPASPTAPDPTPSDTVSTAPSEDSSPTPTGSDSPGSPTVTPDGTVNADTVASALLTASYLDGVIGLPSGTLAQTDANSRALDTSGGYAADAAYPNVNANSTPTQVQVAVSWYTDAAAATAAFDAQANSSDVTVVNQTKDAFTTTAPYLDGQLMVRTVHVAGQTLSTGVCVGPDSDRDQLTHCSTVTADAQATQAAATLSTAS